MKPLERLLAASAAPDRGEQRLRRRGLFPDWRTCGAVAVVQLQAVSKDRATSAAMHMRELCPHCGGEVLVRATTKYNENRRLAIRLHLRTCEKWPGRMPLPYRLGKPMAGDRGRQLQLWERPATSTLLGGGA